MRLVFPFLGFSALLAILCLLSACASINQRSEHSRRYKGYVEADMYFGAPEFQFYPLGTFDHWEIVGTEDCAQQIHRYLDTQPQQRNNDSDTGYSAWAYIELDGERIPTEYTDVSGAKMFRLRIQHVSKLLPGQPSSMGPFSPTGPRRLTTRSSERSWRWGLLCIQALASPASVAELESVSITLSLCQEVLKGV